jgi:hypothetical protein
VGGRLQGGRSQTTAEIRLVEAADAETRGRGIIAEPRKREFVAHGEQDHRVGRGMPFVENEAMNDGDVECRMNGLAGLDTGRKIVTGDQIEARPETLAVRHVYQYTRGCTVPMDEHRASRG